MAITVSRNLADFKTFPRHTPVDDIVERVQLRM